MCAFNVGKNSQLIYPSIWYILLKYFKIYNLFLHKKGYYMLTMNGSYFTEQMETSKRQQCFIINTEGS